ncbi:MAG: hypothetical protein A2W91_03785 [Bacteroidetes bacterium GWF2_38_335]|nr:MAG: hypothetical protein A2W91_03785 [Bacteroidetes bacterium GWF2_38_335]OFY77396.1 MAG: hypothetical protein A2281_00975 [Bacteroidetes bacterium RIFOXYA12_FULL_38_20]HBS87317.1 flagellar motor protein MotB [Bacteroidales bacterium]
MKTLTLFIFLTFLFSSSFSQIDYSTTSKKAIKYFDKGVEEYNNRNDDEALKLFESAVKTDPAFIEPYLIMANIYNEKWEFEKMVGCYEKVISIKPDYDGKIYFFLASGYLSMGKYEDAKKSVNTCISSPKTDPTIKEWAQELLKKAEFGINAMRNPVPFDPKNLGKLINTKYDDYWPSLTADEQILTTTVLLPKDSRYEISIMNSQEDFFISSKVDGEWSQIRNMGKPINTGNNEGAQSFSADGQWFFYTVCERPEDFGSCDIYFSRSLGEFWENPGNLGKPVNSAAWEAQPSISADGKTLFFTSNRAGGVRDPENERIVTQDLWVAYKSDDGKWSSPVNLGEPVNTYGNECSPFIHPDGRTLYFSSDTHTGMGGFDIFVTRLNPDGTWSEPVNLGYPINTYMNEIGLIVNSKGELAMFSSDREGSERKDIYSFELHKEVRPIPVTYMKGYFYDAKTKKRLSTSFDLIDLETRKIVAKSESYPETGEYLVCIPVDRSYAFEASKSGYLFYSENFSLKSQEDPTKPFEKNIPLTPIQKDEIVILNNIFFDTDSFALKGESIAELDVLKSFLDNNPNVKIEIRGHTDNIGTKEYNLKLSENRAKSVYNYLVQKGIDKTRLTYKGYGFSIPLINEDTDAARAKNRRTEFKVVSI